MTVVAGRGPSAGLWRRLRQMLKQARDVSGAVAWRGRSRGHVRGQAFRIRRPERLLFGTSGSLTLGRGSVIDTGASISAYAPVVIGEQVYIGRDAVLVAFAPISIGDRTAIAERVSIHTEDHGPPGLRGEYAVSPIRIAADCWLAAGCVVLRGVSIGEGSTLAASAVATRDVPEHVLAAGVPARVVKPL